MEAIQEHRPTLTITFERCPKCSSSKYVAGRCREKECKYDRRDHLKVDARAILRQRGLV